VGHRERDLRWRQEVRLRSRTEDQQGPVQKRRPEGRACLRVTAEIGALGVGPQGRGHEEAARERLVAQAEQHQPGAEELVGAEPEPLSQGATLQSTTGAGDRRPRSCFGPAQPAVARS